MSDRDGYQGALAQSRKWLADQAAATAVVERSALTRRLQHDLSRIDYAPHLLRVDEARDRISQLAQLGGREVSEKFAKRLDEEEKERLIRTLEEWDLARLKDALVPTAPSEPQRRTLGDLLDQFLAVQRQRMERRQQLDGLRARGKKIHEAKGENMSPGRFARLATAVKAFRLAAGDCVWDETEAAAARAVEKFRTASHDRLVACELAPASFNENVQCARQFCGWAEHTYQLDRLPRDKKLFAKFPLTKTAKAIPIDVLKQLWDGADARGRCFILLALNCAYYAVDISNLTSEMIVGGYLSHTRAKTDVNVRYRLWPITLKYLRKMIQKSGRAFRTARGTPLVRHEIAAKSQNPVCIDNVRLWFVRLCGDLGIRTGKGGYSFSNLRDTAASAVEAVDGDLTDLFTAHVDRRMAAFYVDGKMIDNTRLDKVLHKLERRFSPIWSTRRGAPKAPKATEEIVARRGLLRRVSHPRRTRERSATTSPSR